MRMELCQTNVSKRTSQYLILMQVESGPSVPVRTKRRVCRYLSGKQFIAGMSVFCLFQALWVLNINGTILFWHNIFTRQREETPQPTKLERTQHRVKTCKSYMQLINKAMSILLYRILVALYHLFLSIQQVSQLCKHITMFMLQ